ncbi:type II and III secretion system protein [Rhodopirellula maiorica SM1]|uniref:Type II and III secretion system protein n=1 Tax=Rhodopirellula maiorica SM1 TaxID=1265738 RepID=M5RP14_9BACT|nr:type II and III secretion system protein [Rhodopirellula maiorica SM1]
MYHPESLIESMPVGYSQPEPKSRITSLGPTISKGFRQKPLDSHAECVTASNDAPPLAMVSYGDAAVDAFDGVTINANHEDALPLQPAVLLNDAFVETDVHQAIQSLAEQAGMSVIIDDQVRGSVTAVIEDENFERALRKILLPLGYRWRQDGDEYYVGLPEPGSALFPFLAERYIYEARHRTPESLKSQLPERHLQFVRIMGQGGKLAIEAPPITAHQILRELEETDKVVPQVVLEALVCVYSPETNYRFGFDIQQGMKLDGANAGSFALDGLGVAGQYGPAGFNSQLNDFRFTSALLRALEQEGHVKIRAAPRVTTEDGKKAEIHIGRESFFSVQPSGDGVFYRQDIQKVDSGIMLELTPEIRAPHVTIHIDRAEVSEDIRSDETQANAYDQFPVINRRRVSTSVHVMDGQTIVIGGLTQRQKVDQLNKLPLLGDVPYIGRLFQRIERREQEAEVAIFISPRIVYQDELYGAETFCPTNFDPDAIRYGDDGGSW